MIKLKSTGDLFETNGVDLKLSFVVDNDDKKIEKSHIVKLTNEQYDFYKSMPYFYENIIQIDNELWARELIDDKTVNHYMEGNDLIVEL